jgi:hypothetical protein
LRNTSLSLSLHLKNQDTKNVYCPVPETKQTWPRSAPEIQSPQAFAQRLQKKKNLTYYLTKYPGKKTAVEQDQDRKKISRQKNRMDWAEKSLVKKMGGNKIRLDLHQANS